MTAPDRWALDRWTMAGGIACAVAVPAVVAPSLLVRAYGMPPSAGTGGAALAWRVFGVRTAVIGVAVLRGDASARAAVVPVQLLDQAVFAQALMTGAVPRRTALAAMATSAALIWLARSSRSPASGPVQRGRSPAADAPAPAPTKGWP